MTIDDSRPGACAPRAPRRANPPAASPSVVHPVLREVPGNGDPGSQIRRGDRPDPPFVLEADVANSGCADLCSLMPGTERAGPRTVRFRTEDFRDAFRCVLAWTYLGDSQAPTYPGS